ncbi:MAG TPA: hypothetical protein VJ647_00735, partial [Chitinophagaceae bacterium]|nr:hypothetical protein [Chitinophagaceae bacterium]
MERNLYDDELEDFLKRKANQYKIYPSDKVWSGIYTALHTGRKWHILGGTLLLISILTLITLEKSVPEHTVVKKKPLTTAAVSNTLSTVTTKQENTSNKTAHSAFTLTTGKKWQPVAIAQEAAPATYYREKMAAGCDSPGSSAC